MTAMEMGQGRGAPTGEEVYAQASVAGEVRGLKRLKATAGAVLHFFGDQMTSTRAGQVMNGEVQPYRSDGFHDRPVGALPKGWVEHGRMQRQKLT